MSPIIDSRNKKCLVKEYISYFVAPSSHPRFGSATLFMKTLFSIVYTASIMNQCLLIIKCTRLIRS